MDYLSFSEELKKSLELQEKQFKDSLILNPAENVPDSDIIAPCSSFLHGLYNTDTLRNQEQQINSKIQFSGRTQITQDIHKIYALWKEILGAEAISMRLLSGLHAHIVLFMSISHIGQKVLALPEKAGGHVSSYAILKRLGLQVEDIPYDCNKRRVDRIRCAEMIDRFQPDFIFVDRSEGLIYEDFSWLGHHKTKSPCYKIFDASQYLTNILCQDYTSPFDMGFDLILSTMHKNLPGPQRAFVCAKEHDEMWQQLRSGISTYVSNMHVFSIYSAGLLLSDFEKLKNLSANMIKNAYTLEQEMSKYPIPIIQREMNRTELPTHHCWVGPMQKEDAFELYLTLEHLGIITNYRLLPYNIGYGLRVGLSCATKQGLSLSHIPTLAELIAKAYTEGYNSRLAVQCSDFIRKVKENEMS